MEMKLFPSLVLFVFVLDLELLNMIFVAVAALISF